MEIFDQSKSLIENLDLLSGPILAIIGVSAIIQIRLTKKAIITTSKREAANLAAKQIDHYNNNIIPLQDALYDAEIKEKIEKVKIDIGDFNSHTIEKKVGKEKTIEIMKSRSKLIIPILRTINSMEAFSTYFIKGVADEEIAFSAVGRTFCNSVEGLYFDIATCINMDDDTSFQNTIGLYKIWSERLKKHKLSLEREKILKEYDTIKDQKINAIGTK